MAHVPVPSQKEVRLSFRQSVWLTVYLSDCSDWLTVRPSFSMSVCLFPRWRRLWSAGRRWSYCSAMPVRRSRLRVRQPEPWWASDLSVPLVVCLSFCLCTNQTYGFFISFPIKTMWTSVVVFVLFTLNYDHYHYDHLYRHHLHHNDICSCGSNLAADWWQHPAACDWLITESSTGHVWSCETEESVVSHVQSLCACLRSPSKMSCFIASPERCIERMYRCTG